MLITNGFGVERRCSMETILALLPFQPNQKVLIKEAAIEAAVNCVFIYCDHIQYEVRWWESGTMLTMMLSESELEPSEE